MLLKQPKAANGLETDSVDLVLFHSVSTGPLSCCYARPVRVGSRVRTQVAANMACMQEHVDMDLRKKPYAQDASQRKKLGPAQWTCVAVFVCRGLCKDPRARTCCTRTFLMELRDGRTTPVCSAATCATGPVCRDLCGGPLCRPLYDEICSLGPACQPLYTGPTQICTRST